MQHSADVAIIGGGIVGVSAAAELAGAGLRVTLYERGPDVAASASGRNAGLILQPPDPVMAELFRESLAMYGAIQGTALGDGRRFGLPVEQIAMLGLSADVDLMRRLAAATEAEVIDGRALRALEPMVAEDLVAVQISTGYAARPADATHAFAALARASGATICVGSEARPWVEGGVARGVVVTAGGPAGDGSGSGERVAAGAVLVAAGWPTPGLVDPNGPWRPVRALWGLLVEMAMPEPPRNVLEEITGEDSMHLAMPDDPGPGGADPGAETERLPEPLFTLNPPPLLAGAGAGPRLNPAIGNTLALSEPDPVRLAPRIVEHARRFLPSLSDAWVVGTRVCPRPGSFDGRPLIGFMPGIARLAVAAGNGAWGISTGPATGRLAANAILAGDDRRVPAELRAARSFGG